jgi:hypothetical protein
MWFFSGFCWDYCWRNFPDCLGVLFSVSLWAAGLIVLVLCWYLVLGVLVYFLGDYSGFLLGDFAAIVRGIFLLGCGVLADSIWGFLLVVLGVLVGVFLLLFLIVTLALLPLFLQLGWRLGVGIDIVVLLANKLLYSLVFDLIDSLCLIQIVVSLVP